MWLICIRADPILTRDYFYQPPTKFNDTKLGRSKYIYILSWVLLYFENPKYRTKVCPASENISLKDRQEFVTDDPSDNVMNRPQHHLKRNCN